MWIEMDVRLAGNTFDWKELGLDVKHEFTRRMVRIKDIAYVQELVNDIQMVYFYNNTMALIRGSYTEIRDELIHLSQDEDFDGLT